MLLAIRSTPHSTTKETPFRMMTGRDIRLKLSTLQPPNLQERKLHRTDNVRKAVEQVQRKSKKGYDGKASVEKNRFKEGDLVRTKLPSRKKLESQYSKPMQVKGVTQSTITTMNGRKWHSNRVVPYEEKNVLEKNYSIPWFPEDKLNNDVQSV